MSIALENISFSYPTSPKENIINIPQWSMPEQQTHFVYGPSGSGKSTLLNLITGINKASNGNIYVCGENLSEMSLRQRDKFRANNLGYIFQQFNLVPYLSAIDNIKLANQFSQNKSSKADVEQHISQLLNALNLQSQHWKKPVSRLSVGQQQRVAIARALINTPKLVIADEPTSSLDTASRDSFMALLFEQCKRINAGVLFVSHDMSLTKHFDQTTSLLDINHNEESNRAV